MAHMLKQFIGGAVAVALICRSDAQSCAAGSFSFTIGDSAIIVSHPQVDSGATSEILDCSGASEANLSMRAGEGDDSPGYRVRCEAGKPVISGFSCNTGWGESCAAGSFSFTLGERTMIVSHPQVDSGATSEKLDCSGASFANLPMRASDFDDSPGYWVRCEAGKPIISGFSCKTHCSLDPECSGSGSSSGSGPGGENCTSCAEGFNKNGGCKASETPGAVVDAMVPAGCESCGGAAMDYCTSMGYNVSIQVESGTDGGGEGADKQGSGGGERAAGSYLEIQYYAPGSSCGTPMTKHNFSFPDCEKGPFPSCISWDNDVSPKLPSSWQLGGVFQNFVSCSSTGVVTSFPCTSSCNSCPNGEMSFVFDESVCQTNPINGGPDMKFVKIWKTESDAMGSGGGEGADKQGSAGGEGDDKQGSAGGEGADMSVPVNSSTNTSAASSPSPSPPESADVANGQAPALMLACALGALLWSAA